jgi:hypothetical protein
MRKKDNTMGTGSNHEVFAGWVPKSRAIICKFVRSERDLDVNVE